MDTGCFFARGDFRIVIAFAILQVRDFQYLTRAEHDAHLALFTALWKNVNLAARRGNPVDIERRASEDFHCVLSFTGKRYMAHPLPIEN
jgi:hypothetical protein